MYTHERALTEKYAGKPFAILGVNSDALAQLQKLESEKTVVWRSWADGKRQPITQRWHVKGYPTLYLIDSEGRIRRKGNFRGGGLDQAIESMLQEIELSAARDLIAPKSIWTYYDYMTPPKAGWQNLKFDDSAWKSGRAPFGFGVGDEATLLASGPDKGPESATVCFRREFTVEDPSVVSGLLLGRMCADGVAVYLNGHEIFRDNLPASAQYKDNAPTASPDHGLACRFSNLDAKDLRVGKNVIAVEVHRDNNKERGMRFDLSLGTRSQKSSQ